MSQDDGQFKASEMVRKLLTVGVGAIFLTEESLRGLVSEIKLPREILSGILDSAAKTKREFLSKLTSEIMERVGDKLDPVQIIEEFLKKNEIELSIKISTKPKK